MKDVLFIAKTDLNSDGRILNQIRILQDFYKERININFILLPDKPLNLTLGKNVKFYQINLSLRNSTFFRAFTVFEFTLKVLKILFKINPRIVHVQDMAVVLPIFIYRLLKGKRFTLIYDDHEMPNEEEPLQYKILQYFEVKLMKEADAVIFANKERLELLKKEHSLQSRLTYFLNLPYFEDHSKNVLESRYETILSDLDQEKARGTRFIIHQGVLSVERGRARLAEFSKKLLDNTKMLILGASMEDFRTFIDEFNLDQNRFYFVGTVPYGLLNEFWMRGSAAVIMYLPTYINNRLCAPNRFYIAVKNNMTVLVNGDNPVLRNFVMKYNAGFFIENIANEEDVTRVLSYSYSKNLMEELIDKEKIKFIDVYEAI